MNLSRSLLQTIFFPKGTNQYNDPTTSDIVCAATRRDVEREEFSKLASGSLLQSAAYRRCFFFCFVVVAVVVLCL